MRPAKLFLCCIFVFACGPNFCAAQNVSPSGKAPAAKAEAATSDIKIKVEPELNAAQLQMIDQLRPLLKIELDFAARACRLNDEQRKQLVEASEDTLRSLVTGNPGLAGNVAVARGGVVQRIVIREGNRARAITTSANSRAQFGSQVAALIHTHFPGEIEARYQQECAERAAYQKQAAIDLTLVSIDKQLMLSAEQRKQIGEALAKAWNDPNIPDVRVLMSSAEYIPPPITDSWLKPYLRPAQQAVWQTRNSQTMTTSNIILAPGAMLEQFGP